MMSDELKTPDESPFASPREVLKPTFAKCTSTDPELHPAALLVLIILSFVAGITAFVASFASGLAIFYPRPNPLNEVMVICSRPIGVFAGFGMLYALTRLVTLVHKYGLLWTRSYSSHSTPSPLLSGIYFFCSLSILCATITSIILMPLVLVEAVESKALIVSSFWVVIAVSVAGLVLGVRRLLRYLLRDRDDGVIDDG